MPEILPIFVFIPVSVTPIVAEPLIASVPEYTEESYPAISLFSTAADSPVSRASSTISPAEVIINPSAGKISPPFTNRTSPGTISSALISICLPSRSTLACIAVIDRSASIVFSVLYSWTNPKNAFTTTIPIITTASVQSCIKAEMPVQTIKMIVMISLN